MASRPGQPVGDDNAPIFPSATPAPDDDVHGHVMFEPPVDEDRPDSAHGRHGTSRPAPC